MRNVYTNVHSNCKKCQRVLSTRCREVASLRMACYFWRSDQGKTIAIIKQPYYLKTRNEYSLRFGINIEYPMLILVPSMVQLRCRCHTITGSCILKARLAAVPQYCLILGSNISIFFLRSHSGPFLSSATSFYQTKSTHPSPCYFFMYNGFGPSL